MLNLLKKFTAVVISSGIMIGSSWYISIYIKKELENVLPKAIDKAIRHPLIKDKVFEVSERLIQKLLYDEKTQKTMTQLSLELMSTQTFYEDSLSIAGFVMNHEYTDLILKKFLILNLDYAIKEHLVFSKDLKIIIK
jgi:hypothetical protein